MGVARRAPILVVVASLAGTAAADVDWGRGLVTADGVGLADRHAPSPATAREPARRRAEDAARAKLAAALPKLPVAGGRTVATRLDDPQVKARLDAAVAAAHAIAADPDTDGSWRVTLAVPIEAVRQALAGPRALADADDDPAVVVVEGVRAKPAVGVTVGGIAAATLWVAKPPPWASDAPRVKATRVTAGAIALAKPVGGPSTLFVLVRR